MTSDKVIREGDLVRITTPKLVVRVGYPKVPADYLEQVHQQFGAPLAEIFPGKKVFGAVIGSEQEARKKVEQVLAYMLAKRDKFGGPNRSIHEVARPELLGKTGRVSEIRTVRTGIYYSASGSGEDYEPAGLAKAAGCRLAKVVLAYPYEEVEIRHSYLEKDPAAGALWPGPT